MALLADEAKQPLEVAVLKRTVTWGLPGFSPGVNGIGPVGVAQSTCFPLPCLVDVKYGQTLVNREGTEMKKMMLVSAFALSAMCGTAHASLIGANVSVDFYFPDSSTVYCSSGSSIVGGGVEYPIGCSGFEPVSIDITATQIIVVNSCLCGFASGSFNGFVMSILSGPLITSLTYNALLSTLGSTGTSFTGTSMSFNFASQGNGTAVFDIGTGTSAVPVPAALPLLGSALGFMALAGRRKRKLAKAA